MIWVAIYSMLLILGLGASQLLPLFKPDLLPALHPVMGPLTMACLSYIMIGVGMEFEVDRSQWRRYGKDALVASLAAIVPWFLCAVYFFFAFYSHEIHPHVNGTNSILLALFSAPTSAGLLFSMLIASGLSHSWVFNKARNLAIFDDLVTLLLLLPLKILLMGWHPQLLAVFFLVLLLARVAFRWFHCSALPTSTLFILLYALLITTGCEWVYQITLLFDREQPVQFDVLLPSFALGCCLRHIEGASPPEKHSISMLFMFLIGCSLPPVMALSQDASSWSKLALHVLAITLLSNAGKALIFFFYKKEASWRERLATAIAMFPRGEVGAGILTLAMAFKTPPAPLAAAVLSLALNLLLTGFFIYTVKKLLDPLLPSLSADSLALQNPLAHPPEKVKDS